ncbi:MAG: hypothetical protein HQM12_05765 [SAR324 cluster bacterium]|nr:hypothetical protein [SAR324 cluster bacterium]
MNQLSPDEPIRWFHRLEYAFLLFLRKLALTINPQKRNFFQWCLYALAYHVIRICRSIVKTNLDLAFPNWSDEKKAQIGRDSYRWFSRLSFDALRLDLFAGKTQQLAQLENLAVLDEALEENKGVLLVSGHFGNWEVVAPVLAEKQYSTWMYVGQQSNPLVDEHHNQVRQKLNIQTIGKGKAAALQIGRVLNNKNILCMLVDQNDRKSSLFVDFFGKKASMSKGVASFYLMKRSPIVLVTCPYVGDKVLIKFERIYCELTGNRERDTQLIAQAVTDRLEDVIREYPDQYFWMHRRWRTRPQDDPVSLY